MMMPLTFQAYFQFGQIAGTLRACARIDDIIMGDDNGPRAAVDASRLLYRAGDKWRDYTLGIST